MFLKISEVSQKSTYVAAASFYLKETPALVFSCETCEIFKNTYFEEHLRTTASRIRIITSCHRGKELTHDFNDSGAD